MRFTSISHLRANLNEKFEAIFFSRASKRFHGDKRRTWSVKDQLLTITRQDNSKCYYMPIKNETTGDYTLVVFTGESE